MNADQPLDCDRPDPNPPVFWGVSGRDGAVVELFMARHLTDQFSSCPVTLGDRKRPGSQAGSQSDEPEAVFDYVNVGFRRLPAGYPSSAHQCRHAFALACLFHMHAFLHIIMRMRFLLPKSLWCDIVQ